MLHVGFAFPGSTVFAVIGAGNVVSQKLVPVFEMQGITGYEIHALKEDSLAHSQADVFKHREPSELANVVANTELIPWVATPPFQARSEILESAEGRSMVLEKPLGLTANDYLFCSSKLDLFRNAFVLSYYTQAKFAPLLWALGLQEPSSRLTGYLEGGLQVEDPPLEASLILSEPMTRTAGDSVSPWQEKHLIELAVHGPATLHALGLPAEELVLSEADRVEVMGPSSSAQIIRPGEDRKTVQVHTDSIKLFADGSNRSVVSTRGYLALSAETPGYLPLLALVLDWLEDPSSNYAGGFAEQLSALELLTRSQRAD